jgi:pimeloyl-ACP methyl ester carboxylesterase
MPSKSIVFIHGLFMTGHCWDEWVSYVQSKGYTAQTIAYPGRDRTAAELRANPDPNLGSLTFDKVMEHCLSVIRGLPEPPILIGHSMGGLLVQALLQQGLGAAGIAIDSAPPQGVFTTTFSFIRANFPVINPLNPSSKPFMISFPAFQYAFVNGLAEAEQRRVYDTQVPPEALGIPRGSFTSAYTHFDFSKQRAPLLMLAGGSDHIIPADLNQTNYNRYQSSSSRTDFKLFPNKNHYGFGAPGWQELADYCVEWMDKLG